MPPIKRGDALTPADERARLVMAAKAGDGAAFAELAIQNKGLLYRTALIHMRNEADALDMVDEAVCRAFASIGRLKEPSYFVTWMVRILINCCLDALRRRSRVTPLDDGAPIAAPASNSDERMDLRAAIDGLGDPLRQVIYLKYFEDMTIEQVALSMGIPLGTAKSHLNRALKRLRLSLAEEDQA